MRTILKFCTNVLTWLSHVPSVTILSVAICKYWDTVLVVYLSHPMPATLLHRAWMASHWTVKKLTFQHDFFLPACNSRFGHSRAIKIHSILMKKGETKTELEVDLNTSL